MAAIRCVRMAVLRPFACVSNCRAASRVRQYPAAYTVSTAAQLAATRLFEIRPLPLRLRIPFIVRTGGCIALCAKCRPGWWTGPAPAGEATYCATFQNGQGGCTLPGRMRQAWMVPSTVPFGATPADVSNAAGNGLVALGWAGRY